MNAASAWKILAERCSRGELGDEELLAGCEALRVAAQALGLEKEATAARELAAAIRERDSAQMEFERLFSSPEAFGVNDQSEQKDGKQPNKDGLDGDGKKFTGGDGK